MVLHDVNEHPSILIIAGEPSGDLHAAGVARELLREKPHVQLFGIGGEHLHALGQEQLYDTRRMAIMGFSEVVRHLPFLRRVFRHLEQEIIRRKPSCAILVDYPGFNLRLAKILKKH
ncbi:MAG TPA: lipid-A-disaccharide synthase, partial [Bacteroidetes bacterium]|nr:lipid-A-disaccharide synthase [Bacteroidota bacterium]